MKAFKILTAPLLLAPLLLAACVAGLAGAGALLLRRPAQRILLAAPAS